MTTELTLLVATVILYVLLLLPILVGRRTARGGMDWAWGNRETSLEAAPWVGRAERSHRNLGENLPAFAALVLAAHVAGETSDLTALGAWIFFGARLAHPVIYIAGIRYVRTAVFILSLAGMGIIAFELLT
jgi:uncharacterized MAPEG superfamily protein